MTDTPYPTWTYASSRLVGLEVETDPAGAVFHRAIPAPGWKDTEDVSIPRGKEYVLEHPVPHNQLLKSVKMMGDSWRQAGTYAGKRGGTHVHVQAHDLTAVQLATMVSVYAFFQGAFNMLVGRSRVNNHHCERQHFPVDYRQTLTEYDLLSDSSSWPTRSRAGVRVNRHTRVVNLGPCRIKDPAERSIEFRQGSASTDPNVLFGWATLLVCLVELVSSDKFKVKENQDLWFDNERLEFLSEDSVEYSRDVEYLSRLLPLDVGAWVEWRNWHLNRTPSDDELSLMVDCAFQRPAGLFTLAKRAGLNLAVAARGIDILRDDGRLETVNIDGKVLYTATARAVIKSDLATLDELDSKVSHETSNYSRARA